MISRTHSSPLHRSRVVDLYFMEHRAKMIDIAAFLDRVDRAAPAGESEDYRLQAFRKALEILTDDKGERARRVLEALSDPTREPIEKSPGKGASGAYGADEG